VSNVRPTSTAWLVALCAAGLDARQLAPLLVTEQTPRFDVASVNRNRDRRPGPALKVSACVPTGPNGPAAAGATPGRCFNRNSPGMLAAGGGTLDGLANQLGRLAVIGRPVVNKTELAEVFVIDAANAPPAD